MQLPSLQTGCPPRLTTLDTELLGFRELTSSDVIEEMHVSQDSAHPSHPAQQDVVPPWLEHLGPVGCGGGDVG